MPDSDSEFEAQMEAISRVYGLRAGHVLTVQDYEAIQTFDKASREDQERATDAFHRGYEQGLTEGGGAEVADLKKRIGELSTNFAVERTLKRFAHQDVDKLRGLVASLSSCLTDEGGDWSNEGLDRLRRAVAAALPQEALPDWLSPYREIVS